MENSCNILIVSLHRKNETKLNLKIKKMKLKFTLKSLVIALGLISSTVAFAQEEKVDTLNVHEQRITSIEDGVFQLKKLKFSIAE